MRLLQQWKSLLAAIVTIVALFIAASIMDMILSSLFGRFYSTAAFIVTFGVAGIFAATLAYSYGIKLSPEKNEWARWSLIITNITIGLLSFFFVSVTEGGEYEAAFKSFGVTLALANLFFIKSKLD